MTASRDYFSQPRLSPAGQRLAAVINGFDVDVWVLEIERDAWTRLTFEGDHCCPVWTPDGRHITFQSTRAGTGDIYWRSVEGDGTAEPLLIREHNQYPNSWSADGRTLAFTELHPTTGWDIWVLPPQGDPRPVIATQFNERMPMFSPGGRAMAYVSDQSGRDEVHVQHPGGTRLISNAGGTEPLWSADGRELFYREGNRLMVVSVSSGEAFTAGRPQAIFDGSYRRNRRVPNYDISRDGLRFVMIQDDQESVPAHINVVLNWFEELKRLVPTED